MGILNSDQIKEILEKHYEILNKEIKIDTFVETGTYEGATLESLQDSFERFFSVELCEDLYNRSSNTFEKYKKVFLFQGSSIEQLPKMFPNFSNEPVVFFLDAHYSSGKTARDELHDPPILFEIEIILEQRKLTGFYNDIIIIDDFGQFGTNKPDENWSSISVENIQNILDKHCIDSESYCLYDRLVIHLKNIKE